MSSWPSAPRDRRPGNSGSGTAGLASGKSPKSGPRLVGREDELTAVRDLLDRVRGARTAGLLLTGEPGVGKTALLQAARSMAEGFTCLSCHGSRRTAGAFRVDRRVDYFRMGAGRPLVVPGDSSGSPLTAILSGQRKDIAQPDRHRLTEDQLSVVKRWIDAGAPWRDRPEGK